MNGFSRLLILSLMVLSLTHCAHNPPQTESSGDGTASTSDFSDDLDAPANAQEETQAASEEAPQESQAAPEAAEQAQAEPPPPAQEPVQENAEQKLTDDVEKEIANSEGVSAPPEAPVHSDEFAEFENQKEEVVPPPEIPPAVVQEPTPVAPPVQVANIKDILYKANDRGGTVVVESDVPVTYTTRMNTETNQMIIEIPDARLPQKLKRTLNTKDMKGSIGAIDAYQAKDSNVARIVVQLREGASEPVVQAEGKSLLVISEPVSSSPPAASVVESKEEKEEDKILAGQNIDEFLSGNTKFYGKKISLEVSDIGIKEAIKLISEESGVNLVLAEEVKGTISLKLREVPWDQALIIIMKTKKLGYTRLGNVIRVAPLADIKKEEDDAVKLAVERKNQAPVKVRMIPISYAKVDEIAKQVDTLLKAQGGATGPGATPPTVIADVRTSALVISATEDMIERAVKLIESIDVAPPQVLIEGKVIEASETFVKNIGVNWNTVGQPYRLEGRSSKGDIVSKTDISVASGLPQSPTLGLNFTLGTLDILGDLSATLGFYERNDQIKVISSPRILALQNEKASISQTTKIPVETTATTANGVVQKNITYVDVPVSLDVEPQITNDGNLIMKVAVKRATATSSGTNTAVNERTATSRVLVKNGQTAVIGGIYQNDHIEGETKVPWVGDIPVVGWLFKSKNKSNTRTELLIFLTPRIVGEADSQTAPATGGGTL